MMEPLRSAFCMYPWSGNYGALVWTSPHSLSLRVISTLYPLSYRHLTTHCTPPGHIISTLYPLSYRHLTTHLYSPRSHQDLILLVYHSPSHTSLHCPPIISLLPFISFPRTAQVAACLEDFFGNYYSAHGQYQPPLQPAAQHPCPRSGSPLLCHHTHMTHLCTACAQALYLEVCKMYYWIESSNG
jgi:hypothetical protein